MFPFIAEWRHAALRPFRHIYCPSFASLALPAGALGASGTYGHVCVVDGGAELVGWYLRRDQSNVGVAQ